MTVLTIETSTARCSAALCVDGVAVAVRRNDNDGNHAKLLPTFVQELMQEMRNKNLTLDAVALSEGPGSYTGLRIGTATAKGICYGLDIPLLAVPTTMVIAAQMEGERRVAMIDARRNEVYTATYDANLHELEPIRAEILEPEVKAAWFAHEVRPDAAIIGMLVEQQLAKTIQGTEIAYYEPYYLKEFIAAPSHVKGLQ